MVLLDQSAARKLRLGMYCTISDIQGGIAAAAVILLLPARDPVRHGQQEAGWAGIKRLDYIGAALSLAFVTCLLLALQWGEYFSTSTIITFS